MTFNGFPFLPVNDTISISDKNRGKSCMMKMIRNRKTKNAPAQYGRISVFYKISTQQLFSFFEKSKR